MKKIILPALFALLPSCMWAQAGTLDLTFGSSGLFMTNENVADEGVYIQDMEVGGNDKIVMVGFYGGAAEDVFVACVNANGTLDNTFGNGGLLRMDVTLGGKDRASMVAIQPDGKILVTGVSDVPGSKNFVVRLNADGTYDDTFGAGTGTVFTEDGFGFSDVAVDGQGRIVLGSSILQGGWRWKLWRFKPNGTPDSTFADDGEQTFNIMNNGNSEYIAGISTTAGGEIIVLGSNTELGEGHIIVAKVNNAGNLDVSFGDQGKFLFDGQGGTPLFNAMHVTAGSSVWIGGRLNNKGYIIKLTPQGGYDPNFSTDGKMEVPELGFVGGIRQFSDRLVLTGLGTVNPNNKETGTVCMNLAGTYINTFGNQGVSLYDPHPDSDFLSCKSMGIQSTGHIVHAGGITLGANLPRQVYLIRILNPGFASVVEAENVAFTIYPNPTAEGFRIQTQNEAAVKRVSLVSLGGHELCTWNTNSVQFGLPYGLPAGMYVVRIYMHGGSVQQQLLAVKY